jgi:hypothetical protein
MDFPEEQHAATSRETSLISITIGSATACTMSLSEIASGAAWVRGDRQCASAHLSARQRTSHLSLPFRSPNRSLGLSSALRDGWNSASQSDIWPAESLWDNGLENR